MRSAVHPYQLALDRVTAAKAAVQQTLKRGVKDVIKDPFTSTPPTSMHRRTHRPGRPRKIDSDPELRAFIEARIDRMTFLELASEVASAFPPDRRVGKSAIYDWWKASQSS
nr:hypothetical protein [Marivita sp. S6314]